MKLISIIQPSFLPWLGYFEQMARADVFVYLDDVQYTKQDWRNRNRLKNSSGSATISVPIVNENLSGLRISQVRISYAQDWQSKMLQQINSWYTKAPYAASILPGLRDILSTRFELLVDLNYETVRFLRDHFKITTPLHLASDIPGKSKDKNLKLIDICKHHGADLLYDGKAAQSFIDLELFAAHGVSVIFQDYVHTPYPQLWGDFQSHLSALDLILNCGPASRDILLSSPVPEALHVA